MNRSFNAVFLRISGHQWKETIRSVYWQKNIAINIILGVFLTYFLLNLVFLGLFLGKILDAAFPGSDPVVAFSGIILYYFIADFVLRFLMQPSPVISMVPYLHLPVKRNSVFHFLLIKSAFSLFNFFPLVILLPFMLRNIIPAYAAATGLTWFLTLVLLIFTSNYIAFFFRKLFSIKPAIIILVAVVAASLVWVDLSQDRLISLRFGDGLMYIAQHPVWVLLPAFFLFLSYNLSWQFLHQQRYMEVKGRKERLYYPAGRSRNLFEVFGRTGTLVTLEIKMILRNTRPRTYLFMSFFFLLYGLLIYPKHPVSSGYGMMLFIGLLLTGIMMIQYGQLVFSWESSFFDRLCTANFSTRAYLNAKFWLFFSFNTITFLITLPYALFDFRILLLNLAAWLFNCGINIFLILFLGTYNTKRLDMSKGAFFNYEGVTAVQFILILPVIGLPVLIYWVISLAGSPEAGIIAIGLAGLAGLLFHGRLIDRVTRQFLVRKQKILYGFRNG